jgi:hypothetical protein
MKGLALKILYTTSLIIVLRKSCNAEEIGNSGIICQEKNGFFKDIDQCDLYYECKDNKAEAKLCPDGLLFDDTNSNLEKCDYPFNVNCGRREYVQEPENGTDPKCYRANGFFNHENSSICNRFYNCVNGVPYELPCAATLVFDEARGTCVGEKQATKFARVCEKNKETEKIDGFACPEGETLGPNGQPLAHPSFAHPTSCQKYITCYFSIDIRELGCQKGEVFDHRTLVCTSPDIGPKDCRCWYECLENSTCPKNCRSDCTCPQ